LSDALNHPTAERLEAYVEETLDGADRAVVRSHLATCARCQAEVVEIQSLFEALSGLPELAPSAGFANRVMAGVRVRRPVADRVADWIEQVLPSTNRGWAVAAGAVALPVLASAALVWWILSQPGVSAQNLVLFGGAVASDALAGAWTWVWTAFAGSSLAAHLESLVAALDSLGRGGLGLAAVMFATLTFASIYILYENLFRPSARRTEHASYIF
jgi:anti-sigma factor RsiW